MRVLVTGGAGFVGRDLKRALLDRGDDAQRLRGRAPVQGLHPREGRRRRERARPGFLRGRGQAIYVGTGRPTTVTEMGALLARGLGKELAPVHAGKYRAGDIRHCLADPTRAEELLGFRATVELEDGIGDLLGRVATQVAADRVDEATRELAARGLSR